MATLGRSQLRITIVLCLVTLSLAGLYILSDPGEAAATLTLTQPDEISDPGVLAASGPTLPSLKHSSREQAFAESPPLGTATRKAIEDAVKSASSSLGSSAVEEIHQVDRKGFLAGSK